MFFSKELLAAASGDIELNIYSTSYGDDQYVIRPLVVGGIIGAGLLLTSITGQIGAAGSSITSSYYGTEVQRYNKTVTVHGLLFYVYGTKDIVTYLSPKQKVGDYVFGVHGDNRIATVNGNVISRTIGTGSITVYDTKPDVKIYYRK